MAQKFSKFIKFKVDFADQKYYKWKECGEIFSRDAIQLLGSIKTPTFINIGYLPNKACHFSL